MSYLTKYDNVVMQKCKIMQNNHNIQLESIAQGSVKKSLDGGYIAITPKSSLTEFKKKYQLDDKKFKQMVTIVKKMEIAETDEMELLYAELEEILGLEDSLTDIGEVEQIIQQLQNAQTQTDLPDWLQQASQEMLSADVLEVLPYPGLFVREPTDSPNSVNLVSPISQEQSIPSPDLFAREESPRINMRVSSPNQPRLPTQGSSSNEAIARTQRAKSPSKAVKPKTVPRIPKSMNISTGKMSRNMTGRESDEYFAYLDGQPHFNPNVNK